MFKVAQALMIMLNMYIMIQELNKFDETTFDPIWHNQIHETTKFTQDIVSPNWTQVWEKAPPKTVLKILNILDAKHFIQLKTWEA